LATWRCGGSPSSPGKASWSPCLIFRPLVISILRLPGNEVPVAFGFPSNEVAVAFGLASNEVAISFRLPSNEVARALQPVFAVPPAVWAKAGAAAKRPAARSANFNVFIVEISVSRPRQKSGRGHNHNKGPLQPGCAAAHIVQECQLI
jgi:hypothetical protein